MLSLRYARPLDRESRTLCVPKKHRSQIGQFVDEIYDHLESVNFCSYSFDKNFTKYMIDQDSHLRGSRNYLNVMRRVEEYITKFSTQWLPEFRTFVLNDFNDFLWSIGAFVSVPPPKRLGAAASWLYFYCGIISLDQAHRDGKIN